MSQRKLGAEQPSESAYRYFDLNIQQINFPIISDIIGSAHNADAHVLGIGSAYAKVTHTLKRSKTSNAALERLAHDGDDNRQSYLRVRCMPLLDRE